MSSALEIKHLSKSYGSKIALDDLTASFPAGQITGLIGPNGAGKSTLLKAIVGLVKPQQGSIGIFDQPAHWKLNAEIAYLPDRAKWYKSHTIKQALNYALNILPGFDLPRALEMANLMSLDLDVLVSTLSEGHEARLHIILCLARRVKLVLLDEPFSGIDLLSRETIIQLLINSMLDQPQTILISSHEIHEAESLFEHVVFLNKGQLVLEGNAEALRQEKGSIESIYRGLFR
ncbi:ATP-binding cassette domain-containing protein [Desulfosporosinus lacus]|uniref:ABC-2 type transport system ATP-binding protein n=1 Tax=Desulfosporosinus lacus DSM 15449 TaxID=1121420 RepID=A0A1M6ETY2_9FIRM|nr:ABC transporter ATP-binding protein [Desulfosporosinus lacus]SHI88873.1 ABC-2 type transport system ATP-binding protein [Desulfosporosinus lacus DSM 15449]